MKRDAIGFHRLLWRLAQTMRENVLMKITRPQRAVGNQLGEVM
jgi:hypothetical protein